MTFIDLFAGIGGFHLGMREQGFKCVLACEIDKFARKTYRENFLKDEDFPFETDVSRIDIDNLPDFDVLCAGFPCQPFSKSGKMHGFDDVRGTLFFDIANIISKKRPKAFFLENVRNIVKHDNGNTFKTIKDTLENLNYSFHYKILSSVDFNRPQKRERAFMIGFNKDLIKDKGFKFPEKMPLKITMSDIFGGKCNKDVGWTIRVGGRSSPITSKHNWDGYYVDGKMVRLSSKEALIMQGFPKDFIFPVSENQAMKQLGNSVTVTVISALAKNIKNVLEDNT